MGEITPYAEVLYKELKDRGINAQLEFFDGHKSVDINIPEANLVIEVDGRHHSEAEQALADLKRGTYSLEDGKFTYHLPNSLIFKYPSECADLIERMVDNLIRKNKGKQKNISRKRVIEDEEEIPTHSFTCPKCQSNAYVETAGVKVCPRCF